MAFVLALSNLLNFKFRTEKNSMDDQRISYVLVKDIIPKGISMIYLGTGWGRHRQVS